MAEYQTLLLRRLHTLFRRRRSLLPQLCVALIVCYSLFTLYSSRVLREQEQRNDKDEKDRYVKPKIVDKSPRIASHHNIEQPQDQDNVPRGKPEMAKPEVHQVEQFQQIESPGNGNKPGKGIYLCTMIFSTKQ